MVRRARYGAPSADALARPSLVGSPVLGEQEESPAVLVRVIGNELVVAIGENVPKPLTNVIRSAVALLNLETGWNSYQAQPVETQNVIRSITLLSDLLDDTTPTPQIVPTVRGGVQIEWHRNGLDLEILVSRGTEDFFIDRPDAEPQEYQLAGNEELLRATIAQLGHRL
jgi:hypothetical protein